MKRYRRHLRRLVILAAVLAFICLDSRLRLETAEYTVTAENIPAAFQGWRIAQLSDLHLTQFGEDNERLIRAITDAQPDIIAITGDMVDTDTGWEDYVRSLMARLTPIAPVYYVSGNHEWAAGIARALFDVLADCGVTVLRNQYIPIEIDGERIILAGVDDPNGPWDMISPAELYERIAADYPDTYTVLLAHRNTELYTYAGAGFDLTLCGHGHGGVIRLPFTDGLINTEREWFPTHTSGLYRLDGMSAVVSRGLGNNLPVPRFLNRPHIPVVVLERE